MDQNLGRSGGWSTYWNPVNELEVLRVKGGVILPILLLLLGIKYPNDPGLLY